MKRYRVLRIDFDARVHSLTMQIEDWWEPLAQQLHRENREKVRQGLLEDFGTTAGEQKLTNFVELGAAPFSIVAYHNRFLRQIRHSFVIGGYYPSLTGACALGERILNHLLLSHRDFFKSTSEYKSVYRKDSFDNWDVPIDTLHSWGVLQADAVAAFNQLKDIRNDAIHFNPATDHNDRSLALTAIHTLGKAIDSQFTAFGVRPWFIPNTPGTTFVKKSFENDPFIKTVYIPNCAYVGPFHTLEPATGGWRVHDNHKYDEREISDEEFAALYNDKTTHPSAS